MTVVSSTVSEETRFDDRIRSIERVFEAALQRTTEEAPDADVVPADLRRDIIEQRFADDTTGDYEYQSKFSRCLSFLSTVSASLAAKVVRDITDEQVDVLRAVYRFVTGPVRECSHRVDPETDADISTVDIHRLTKEMHHLASEVRETDLLTSEHTYS